MADIFELLNSIGFGNNSSSEPVKYMVVGLGNPDAKYANTRHNAGFMVIDKFASEIGAKIDRAKFNALTGICDIDGTRVLLMKPLTYMNNSGIAVRAAADFYKIAPENIIVIVDEISLDVGRVRIRKKGRPGGHNGMESIIQHLGTDTFPRIKMGVGNKPHPDYNLADWVLGDIPKEQRELFAKAAENAILALRLMLADETDKAMNKYNS